MASAFALAPFVADEDVVSTEKASARRIGGLRLGQEPAILVGTIIDVCIQTVPMAENRIQVVAAR